MGDVAIGPSASCVQAHNEQIASNDAIIRQDRAAVAQIDQVLPGARDAFHAARGVYEGRYGRWDRMFSAEASQYYSRNVAGLENVVNNLTTNRARRLATADEIERINKMLAERGPQRTGECTVKRATPPAAPHENNPPRVMRPAPPLELPSPNGPLIPRPGVRAYDI